MDNPPTGPANPRPILYQLKANQQVRHSKWTKGLRFALPIAILGQVYVTYDDFLSLRQTPDLGDWRAWMPICIGLFLPVVLAGYWIQLMWPSKNKWTKSLGIHPCSFCGKSLSERKRIIAGPGVHICDSCVTVCKTIIDRESTPSEAKG